MTSSSVKQGAIVVLSLAVGAGSMALLKSKSEKPDVAADISGRATAERSQERAKGARDVAAKDAPRVTMAEVAARARPNQGPDPEAPAPKKADGDSSADSEPVVTTFEQTEDDFAVEARDPRWAADHESAIVTIAQRFPKARAGEVECRSAHCRMVVSFPGVEEYNAMFRGIAEDPDLKQSGMVADVGSDRATVYIKRHVPESRPN